MFSNTMIYVFASNVFITTKASEATIIGSTALHTLKADEHMNNRNMGNVGNIGNMVNIRNIGNMGNRGTVGTWVTGGTGVT